MAILTTSFPETIFISQLRLQDEYGNYIKNDYGLLDKKREFEILNYSKEIDTINQFENHHTLKLNIENSVLYGNNTRVGKFLKVNNIDFYYEIYGTGEPLLLLHGNNESINSFRNQIDAFKKNYRVIAVDSRCQGRSSCNDLEMSYSQMADDMNLLLDSLKISEANVLGWSDGGNTGITMALNYPLKVKKLITMGANIQANTNAIEPIIWGKFKSDIKKAKLAKVFFPELKNTIKVSEMCIKYPNINPENLNTIKIPVLILAGEKDFIRKEHTYLIGKNIPNSEVHIFPNLTHYAPLENPTDFNKIVLDFLDKN